MIETTQELVNFFYELGFVPKIDAKDLIAKGIERRLSVAVLSFMEQFVNTDINEMEPYLPGFHRIFHVLIKSKALRDEVDKILEKMRSQAKAFFGKDPVSLLFQIWYEDNFPIAVIPLRNFLVDTGLKMLSPLLILLRSKMKVTPEMDLNFMRTVLASYHKSNGQPLKRESFEKYFQVLKSSLPYFYRFFSSLHDGGFGDDEKLWEEHLRRKANRTKGRIPPMNSGNVIALSDLTLILEYLAPKRLDTTEYNQLTVYLGVAMLFFQGLQPKGLERLKVVSFKSHKKRLEIIFDNPLTNSGELGIVPLPASQCYLLSAMLDLRKKIAPNGSCDSLFAVYKDGIFQRLNINKTITDINATLALEPKLRISMFRSSLFSYMCNLGNLNPIFADHIAHSDHDFIAIPKIYTRVTVKALREKAIKAYLKVQNILREDRKSLTQAGIIKEEKVRMLDFLGLDNHLDVNGEDKIVYGGERGMEREDFIKFVHQARPSEECIQEFNKYLIWIAVLLGFLEGCRSFEIIDAEPEKFEFDLKLLKLSTKGNVKYKKEYKVVPLSDFVIKELTRFLKIRRMVLEKVGMYTKRLLFLIGKSQQVVQLTNKRLNQELANIAVKAGVKVITTHGLRTMCQTAFTEAELSFHYANSLLGHYYGQTLFTQYADSPVANFKTAYELAVKKVLKTYKLEI